MSVRDVNAVAGSSGTAGSGTDAARREKIELSLKKRYGSRRAEIGRGPSSGPPGPGSTAGTGERPRDYKKTFKFLISYILHEKLRISIALLMVLIYTMSTLTASYMLRPIINTYIVPVDGSRGDPAGLLRAVAFMLLVYAAGIAANYVQSRLLTRIGQNCLKEMREDLFDHIESLPVKFYDTNARGDIMSRFTNDIDNIGIMLSSSLISIFTAVVTLIGTFTLMVYTNLVLTVVTVVTVPMVLFVIKQISVRSAKYFSMQQSALGALNAYVEEAVTGQKVIKVFNHEEAALEEFGVLNQHLKDNQILAQLFGGVMGPAMNCSSQVSYTLTAVVGGLLVILRGFDIGGLTVFLNYSRQFSRPINEMANTTTSIFSALAGAERVIKVMEEEPEEPDPEDAYDPGRVKGDVIMEGVWFGYTEDKMILKDIGLYAHPGQKIAFVGSTGAGKTTVMNLLPRFYDIQEGNITIDGTEIKRYRRKTLRDNITMVLQESHLFTGTIMDNIRYGRLSATDAEVRSAARTASADSFIRHLPDGYNTMIDADGSNLSQGQRQLINIARAAVSKAPILILDEATSSVDTKTERLIDNGMHSLMENRTTFVIAHRLSTVRDADCIMVLEQGRIIERGTHEELLTLKGRYYELYTGLAELS